MFKIFKSFYTAEWKCIRHSSRTSCNPRIGQGRKHKKKNATFLKKKMKNDFLECVILSIIKEKLHSNSTFFIIFTQQY